jgi:hypothetical protein
VWEIIDKSNLIVWLLIGIFLIFGVLAILCLYAGCVISDSMDKRRLEADERKKAKMGKAKIEKLR